MYKAKNVDTDKALNYINESRRYQQQAETLEIKSAQKYHEGIRKGLDIAEEIFTCGNCESNAGTYRDGVLDVIYEIGKELDVQSQDIRDKGGSVDEMCAVFAGRIRDAFSEEFTQQN
ncbi:hypothetical protein [[Clostridium] symbiosum]|uniref:hypothetical protein n=1 Tax=Clostridium symbiosum TaxID=1512 RepID=UPI0018A0593B|nr:hypothetical protein [[Clostridium] symbiosum]